MRIRQRSAVFSVILALVTLGALGCKGNGPPPSLGGVSISPRLTIQVHGTELADKLVYQEDGQTYTVTAPAGMHLLALEATLTNPGAETALFVIGAQSANLEDKRNNSFPLQDPRADRQVTPNATAPKYYTPWLWGPFSLNRGFGIKGWLFFQVPEGTPLDTITSLSWSTLDSMSVRLTPQAR